MQQRLIKILTKDTLVTQVIRSTKVASEAIKPLAYTFWAWAQMKKLKQKLQSH